MLFETCFIFFKRTTRWDRALLMDWSWIAKWLRCTQVNSNERCKSLSWKPIRRTDACISLSVYLSDLNAWKSQIGFFSELRALVMIDDNILWGHCLGALDRPHSSPAVVGCYSVPRLQKNSSISNNLQSAVLLTAAVSQRRQPGWLKTAPLPWDYFNP